MEGGGDVECGTWANVQTEGDKCRLDDHSHSTDFLPRGAMACLKKGEIVMMEHHQEISPHRGVSMRSTHGGLGMRSLVNLVFQFKF